MLSKPAPHKWASLTSRLEVWGSLLCTYTLASGISNLPTICPRWRVFCRSSPAWCLWSTRHQTPLPTPTRQWQLSWLTLNSKYDHKQLLCFFRELSFVSSTKTQFSLLLPQFPQIFNLIFDTKELVLLSCQLTMWFSLHANQWFFTKSKVDKIDLVVRPASLLLIGKAPAMTLRVLFDN